MDELKILGVSETESRWLIELNNGGAYVQRKPPEVAGDDPLTGDEQLIVALCEQWNTRPSIARYREKLIAKLKHIYEESGDVDDAGNIMLLIIEIEKGELERE